MVEYYSSTSEILWDVFLASVPLLLAIFVKPRLSIFATAVAISYWLTNTLGTTGLFWYYVFSIVVWWGLESYSEYRDLMQPGQKPTVMGWFRITALVKLARVDVLKPPRIQPTEAPYRGRLFALKKRIGERPTVKKVAPSRQVDQKASPAMFYRLVHLLRMKQSTAVQALQIKMSVLEDGSQALFWNLGERSPGAINQREEWGGEIAHVHATDGSLHVLLHPEDVKTVIEAGWGERHPLCANDKWFFRFLFHGLREKPLPVPAGWTLIYAPRNNNELDTIRPIITAAIWYATGGALHPVTIATGYPDPTTQNDEGPKRYPWWEWVYGLIPAPPASKSVRPCMCGPNCSGSTPPNAPTTTNTNTQNQTQGGTQTREENTLQEDYDSRIDQAMQELDRILEERQRESQRQQNQDTEDDDNEEGPEPKPATPAPLSDPGGGRRIGKLARTMYPLSSSNSSPQNRRYRQSESDPGVGIGRTPRRADGGLHFDAGRARGGCRLGTVREESSRRNNAGPEGEEEESNWGEWDEFF
ncbi:hypothetical protein QBC38DRAFT_429965 [Podospora fimiseda]|uniref:Luciferase domain-containing protein n=1 Tax=Podospora fimiseda TaxID=252190 RepID=A0AAN6YKF5_9PEZI|nr:hypothetical protein QBC38DRAFT_429965 [Podospora fimiseda]